jgi:ERCC4-type nuclease
MKEWPFRIVVDTREQTPLAFGDWPVVRTGLKTGDYSIEGAEDRVALERKSLPDAYACVGRERDRFERELVRLAALEYGAIVIEATLADVLAGVPRSAVSPKAAGGSLLAWSVEHRLPVFFAGTRPLAAATVLKLLTKWFQKHSAVAKPRR